MIENQASSFSFPKLNNTLHILKYNTNQGPAPMCFHSVIHCIYSIFLRSYLLREGFSLILKENGKEKKKKSSDRIITLLLYIYYLYVFKILLFF